jgi:hypothetical protein
MKNLYQKILPFFSASCVLSQNKQQEMFKTLGNSQEIRLIAKISQNSKTETNIDNFTTPQLRQFLDELNKTEIYLLVTEFSEEKANNPILLLLHTEDRLNSEQTLINYRHLKFLFSSSNTRYSKNRSFSVYEMIRPNWFPTLSKSFRGGKSYYENNVGGYKSICPVFFDKNSAEDFLIQSSKDTLNLLNNLPLESNKEIIQGLLNTKIISIGLGDFVEYYSLEKNKEFLKSVDFLFVPLLQKENPQSKEFEKKINTLISKKTFKSYQKQYYKLKSTNI